MVRAMESPIALQSEYRPPTQSQNSNMFSLSIPNFTTSFWFVERAIKCLAISRDKQFIASADYAGHIFVYDKYFNMVAHHRPTTMGISSIIAGQSAYEFMASSYDGMLYSIPFEWSGEEDTYANQCQINCL